MLHRHLVSEDERGDDPTAGLEGVRVPAGIPKPLTEAEVASLLDAVTGHDPVARRDRALLELLYGTGARVSEACGLSMGDIDFDGRLVRLFGKGSKERIVPFGRSAAAALDEWFASGGRIDLVPAQWRRRNDATSVFLEHAWRTVDPAGCLGGDQEVRRPRRTRRRIAWWASPLTARASAQLRDPHARPRRRSPGGAGDARTRVDLDHPDLHQGQPGKAVAGVPRSAPAGCSPDDRASPT